MRTKRVAIYSFTEAGSHLEIHLLRKLEQEGYVCTGYTVARFAEHENLQALKSGWKEQIGRTWGESALVFIGAAGIAIRVIAPYIKDKFTDPPILVLDEKGIFVIPLLSGHVGGGVELANILAAHTGGRAVITTATDVQEKFAVDVFATQNRLVITSREEAKRISAGILDQKTTGIFSEFELSGDIPEELILCSREEELENCYGKIMICQKKPKEEKKGILYLLPKNLYVGMGCRRGVPEKLLEEELNKVLTGNGLVREQICALGSIDLKKDEEGLLELAKLLGIEFCTYPAEVLQKISTVSASSEFVRQVTGVDNVCERAAKKMCPDGILVQKKVGLNQCTVAIVRSVFRVNFSRQEEEKK